jgi:DNA (cytosine-5)-methyltransferase 1
MDARRIVLTSSALAHGRLNLRACGRGFFPEESYGKPSRADGVGESLRLQVEGFPEIVETDLPTDRAGRVRWFFRARGWVKEFVRAHHLSAGDTILLTRIGARDYRIGPVFRDLRFVDLFAGVGGMRLGFEAAGARCVFSVEWDKHCQRTYEANFGDVPAGDIRTVRASEIPDHDILVGGFPCQPFSIAGVSKKNSLGQAHGFRCKTQGTLFFEVARIIAEKQPRAFVLENVKNLLRHDKGKTFAVIEETLRDELGYDITWKVIDAQHVLPHHRERVFIVGSKPGVAFAFPTPTQLQSFRLYSRLGDLLESRVPAKYTLTDHLWSYLQRYAEKHREAGNGFGFGLVGPSDIARTLSARYYKDGSEILIRQRDKNPRRLTPRECARLLGFPNSFKIIASDTQAYKQFGNSVAVPVVHAIAERLVACLRESRFGPAPGTQLTLVADGEDRQRGMRPARV